MVCSSIYVSRILLGCTGAPCTIGVPCYTDE